jgi:hypothetical protein
MTGSQVATLDGAMMVRVCIESYGQVTKHIDLQKTPSNKGCDIMSRTIRHITSTLRRRAPRPDWPDCVTLKGGII